MFDLSCADYTFPLLSRKQAFALLQLLEFQFVDLGLFERNDHLRTSEMLTSPRQFKEGLVSDLAQAELAVADVFLQIGTEPQVASTNDPDAAVRERNREIFKRTAELCVRLQCPHLTGLPGVLHTDPERDFAVAAEENQWRSKWARMHGITYAIEPHIGSICADVASTLRLLEAVKGLTLTLDYGHFVASGSSADDVHTLLPFASHLHMRGGAPGRLQTNVDDNTIPFEQVLQRLQTLHYKGKLALEYVWIDWEGCNRSDTLSETILLRKTIRKITETTQGKAGRNV